MSTREGIANPSRSKCWSLIHGQCYNGFGGFSLWGEGSCIGQGKDSWKNIAWGFQELVVLLSLKDTCICELRVCYCLNEHYWDFGIVSVLFVSLVLRVYFWCFGIWVSHVCERFWECLSLWRLWVLFGRVLWVLFVRVSHVFVVHIVDNRFWLSSTLDVGM